MNCGGAGVQHECTLDVHWMTVFFANTGTYERPDWVRFRPCDGQIPVHTHGHNATMFAHVLKARKFNRMITNSYKSSASWHTFDMWAPPAPQVERTLGWFMPKCDTTNRMPKAMLGYVSICALVLQLAKAANQNITTSCWVHVRLRVRVHVHAHVRVYICTCVRVYMCTCVRAYVCVRVYVCTCVPACVCVYVYVYVYVYAYAYAYAYAYEYVYVHEVVYTDVHTCI